VGKVYEKNMGKNKFFVSLKSKMSRIPNTVLSVGKSSVSDPDSGRPKLSSEKNEKMMKCNF
jgi:hypothetical protein